MSSRPLCIYHKNCADGFGAAYVVDKYYRGEVDFYPDTYPGNPPNVTGRDVIIVDYSYKKDVIFDLATKANTILIIDHHITAEQELTDLPANVAALFDKNHSGCVATWKYFFKDEPVPFLLECVQDRDLWLFKSEYTKDIMAVVHAYEFEFPVWDTLMSTAIYELVDQGKLLNRKYNKDLKSILKDCVREVLFDGHIVPIANLPGMYASEAGAILSEGYPFAITYWDRNDCTSFSLRSSKDGLDVSEIAKKFGGGGHKHAAGFTIPIINSIFDDVADVLPIVLTQHKINKESVKDN